MQVKIYNSLLYHSATQVLSQWKPKPFCHTLTVDHPDASSNRRMEISNGAVRISQWKGQEERNCHFSGLALALATRAGYYRELA